MPTYHINAAGEPGVCRARVACPFGLSSDHFATAADARLHFEKVMAGEMAPSLFSLLSPKGSPLIGPEDALAFTASTHGEFKKLEESLTEEEESSLQNYAMVGFERVNAYLRGLPPPSSPFEKDEEQLRRTEEQIATMERVFAKASPKPRTVYRFTKASGDLSVKEAIEKLKEENTFSDEAYLSTSASIDYPLYEVLDHPDDRLFLLEIATDQGIALQRKAYPQPGHIQSTENEILLPKAMKFEVAAVEARKKVGFGGMAEVFKEKGSMYGDSPGRRLLAKKDRFSLPVVKLVQV